LAIAIAIVVVVVTAVVVIAVVVEVIVNLSHYIRFIATMDGNIRQRKQS
jgi:hypothetical protein